MVYVLDMIWDKIALIFIFPAELVDNFYNALAKFHNGVLEWAQTKGSREDGVQARRGHRARAVCTRKQQHNTCQQTKAETPFANFKITGKVRLNKWGKPPFGGHRQVSRQEQRPGRVPVVDERLQAILEKKNNPNLNSSTSNSSSTPRSGAELRGRVADLLAKPKLRQRQPGVLQGHGG